MLPPAHLTIIESTKENQWAMPHHYDLQATMQKHGFTVKPVKVFSICKPDIAVRILDNDTDKHVSAMMPCRVAVYEKSDGKKYDEPNAISYLSLTRNLAYLLLKPAAFIQYETFSDTQFLF